jgi:cytochrome P450
MHPTDPVAATSHSDPYPYYRSLLAGPALARGAQPGQWIASRAATIAEVLAHPDCVVRPVAEPVPAAIAGTSAGAIFGRLARMNEGAAHAKARGALAGALASVDPARLRECTRAQAHALAGRHALPAGAALTRWMFNLPTCVVADLLGVEAAALAPLAREVADFVRCLSPLSAAAELADADSAANALLARFTALLRADAAGTLRAADGAPIGLLARVRGDAAAAGGIDHDALVANLIGLLSQTHEATAGLIGNSVVALACRPQLLTRLRGDPLLAEALVREVARVDASVQNTRRFVARACTIAGTALAAGDTIMLLLAAAGRDPAVHEQPDEIDLERAAAPLPGFGHGRHACPGQQLALAIAAAAVAALLAMPLAFERLRLTYRPSANARLPLFTELP